MGDYLSEQTAGSLVRNTFRIYFHDFVPLFVMFAVPAGPFMLLQVHGRHTGNLNLSLFAGVAYVIVALMASIALTVAVSDICLGTHPEVKRAYKRGFGGATLKALWTAILATGIFVATLLILAMVTGGLGAMAGEKGAAIALLALALACLVAIVVIPAWFMLSMQVVVLESRWGWSALMRSRSLGKGHYVRNLLVLGVCWAVAFVTHMITVMIVYGVLVVGLGEGEVADVVTAVASIVFAPLYAIATVLLYYDMRVRKEAYDIAGLIADLTEGEPYDRATR